jgi:formylmethanofuran dehydrogenase subunit C
MSALTFTVKQATAQRVDMSPLTCQLLKGLSIAEIYIFLSQAINNNFHH